MKSYTHAQSLAQAVNVFVYDIICLMGSSFETRTSGIKLHSVTVNMQRNVV